MRFVSAITSIALGVVLVVGASGREASYKGPAYFCGATDPTLAPFSPQCNVCIDDDPSTIYNLTSISHTLFNLISISTVNPSTRSYLQWSPCGFREPLDVTPFDNAPCSNPGDSTCYCHSDYTACKDFGPTAPEWFEWEYWGVEDQAPYRSIGVDYPSSDCIDNALCSTCAATFLLTCGGIGQEPQFQTVSGQVVGGMLSPCRSARDGLLRTCSPCYIVSVDDPAICKRSSCPQTPHGGMCNGQGSCTAGQCQCNFPYTGSDCGSQISCSTAGNCSSFASCNWDGIQPVCTCHTGLMGDGKTCVLLPNVVPVEVDDPSTSSDPVKDMFTIFLIAGGVIVIAGVVAVWARFGLKCKRVKPTEVGFTSMAPGTTTFPDDMSAPPSPRATRAAERTTSKKLRRLPSGSGPETVV